MSLLDTHNFELSLVEPCLAMSERGLLIDEHKRQEMITALDNAKRAITWLVSAGGLIRGLIG